MDKKLNLTIMTPQRIIVENKKVDSVTLPAWEGEMCVLYNHLPYIGQLRKGYLNIEMGRRRYFLFLGIF
jgi:F0F1-type ATP synthase, epsilon subunit (mitochondrial delta subunit)